jgi:hypothetical protein
VANFDSGDRTERDGGTEIWNAKCAQGQSYVVSVKSDGSTRVAACIDIEV